MQHVGGPFVFVIVGSVLLLACSSSDSGERRRASAANTPKNTPASGGSPATGSTGVGGLNIGGPMAGSSSGGTPGQQDLGGCGDGVLQPERGEMCDDANSASGDGCAATCTAKEKDFECPMPGTACVSTVQCGDGRISGNESCDDGNATTADGCSETCAMDPGWKCPILGARCIPLCGDGVLTGPEQCDDKNQKGGDGCSTSCRLERGWVCEPPGTVCKKAECGNGKKEGLEPCDDGNKRPFDGCSPECEVEPRCNTGTCSSTCGDGLRMPNEQCDDGNQKSGDGCSSSCEPEAGYVCTDSDERALKVYIVYRDFISLATAGHQRHPDFEFGPAADTPTLGLVKQNLDAQGKPVYTGACPIGTTATGWCTKPCPWGGMVTSTKTFEQWYRDVPGINITMPAEELPLVQRGNLLEFDSAAFYPVNGRGFVTQGGPAERAATDNLGGTNRNFGFTSELHYWFQYQGGEEFSFRGDDDVWVFINGKLALDLGGAHMAYPGQPGIPACSNTCQMGCSPPDPGVLKLDTLGLTKGNIYEIAMFHAERQSNASNYKLTLKGFAGGMSTCTPRCGDGVVAGLESCDCGNSAASSTCSGRINDGAYGNCKADCTPGPRCGDGQVQNPEEQCDDGVNLSAWAPEKLTGACAPGCKLPSYCGDGQVDSLFGEKCDDGVNAGGYGKCNANCTLGPRCGDGVIQTDSGEQCDDGNTVYGDGCTERCQNELR